VFMVRPASASARPSVTDSRNRNQQVHVPACRALAALRCLTMKTATVTIRLDETLERELERACVQTGRTRSDLARDALRRQIALLRFERLRKKALPLAEARGYLTDDDVFRELS